MKEKEFISIIKNTLNSQYIGDDCAYLKDLGITISQDSLVEDIHFKRNLITPFQLGYKSVMVNLSDIASSGAQPKYLTVSLSLPENIDADFVKEFYKGAKTATENDIEIVGGDITGADKIYISVCALGQTKNRNISSRKNAQIGYKVVVSGEHGSSGAGLKMLLNGQKTPEKFIKAHLEPKAQIEFGTKIAQTVKEKYAMTDSSDGLMEALSLIAHESNLLLDIDFDKIPHDKALEEFENWQELVLFGAEDYQLVAVIPENYNFGTCIGYASSGKGVRLNNFSGQNFYTKDDVDKKIYNHFGN